ncbi:hypothetical protein FB451DRAFT_1125319 [Mycena latifolia]|nr:hypothetical protein FB451DRAFT_1125319 [Mycena latifolia]
MDLTGTPTLPLELEREIFEVVARLHPRMAPTLMRVASRVLVWIEPMVYETLIVKHRTLHSSFLLAFESKPASFFRTNVRNLLLGDRLQLVPDELNMLLSACNGVVNIALFRPHHSMLPHLAAMKLQRLTVELLSLFYPQEINFTQPLFSALTHLDARDWGDVDHYSGPSGLASLPELTHLTVFHASRSVLSSILSDCKKLQILIRVTRFPPLANASRELSIDDPRFVLMSMTYNEMIVDWEAATQGECNFWDRADIFVAKRRRGEIHPASRCWIEADDMIH